MPEGFPPEFCRHVIAVACKGEASMAYPLVRDLAADAIPVPSTSAQLPTGPHPDLHPSTVQRCHGGNQPEPTQASPVPYTRR